MTLPSLATRMNGVRSPRRDSSSSAASWLNRSSKPAGSSPALDSNGRFDQYDVANSSASTPTQRVRAGRSRVRVRPVPAAGAVSRVQLPAPLSAPPSATTIGTAVSATIGTTVSATIGTAVATLAGTAVSTTVAAGTGTAVSTTIGTAVVARAAIGGSGRHVVVVECHVFLHLERRRSAPLRTLASRGKGQTFAVHRSSGAHSLMASSTCRKAIRSAPSSQARASAVWATNSTRRRTSRAGPRR